jgi:hypothetical protein
LLGAGAADAVAIAAGGVAAPAADIALGGINKNPATVFVVADFQAIVRLLNEAFSEGRSDIRKDHMPARLDW